MFGLALVWIAFLSIDYALMLVTEGTIDRFPTPFGPLTPPRDDRMNAADRHQRGGQVATLGTQERLTLRKRDVERIPDGLDIAFGFYAHAGLLASNQRLPDSERVAGSSWPSA